VRILLDECVDQRLAGDLAVHEVYTVKQMGWKSMQNGEILTLAASQFEAFVTTGRNLSFQRNLQGFNIAVVVLTPRTNRLNDLRPIVHALLKVLPFVKRGEVREIGD